MMKVPMSLVGCVVVFVVAAAPMTSLAQAGRAPRAKATAPASEAVNTDAAQTQPRPQIVLTSQRPANAAETAPYGLTRRDLDILRRALPDITPAVPVRELPRELRFGERTAGATLCGTIAEYAQTHPLTVIRGRFLAAEDVDELRNVIVIDQTLARQLFGEDEPVGQAVRVGRHYFLVVGIIAPAGQRLDGALGQAYIPITTMRSRLGDRELVRAGGAFRMQHFELTRIELTLPPTRDVEATATALHDWLLHMHPDASFAVNVPPVERPGTNP